LSYIAARVLGYLKVEVFLKRKDGNVTKVEAKFTKKK
jgi:hypothetical protein